MTVKMLLVEDEASDVKLVQHVLRAAGMETELVVADDREGFLAGLSQCPDVVLCDVSLPSFGAVEALGLLRQRGDAVPVIIVSGFLPDGEAAALLARGASDYLLKDRLSRLPSAVRSVLERSQLIRQAEQARFDPLTGLLNRGGLAAALEARRDRPYGVCVLDLDGFKSINDRWGHQAGDAVLVAVSQRLRDAALQPDAVARWGGDEFVVVLDGVPSQVMGELLAARLRDAVTRPLTLREGVVTLGACTGLALAQAGDDPREVLAAADAAMYVVKRG
jgi:diguanylate cyclase (GGDEF)-like protein